MYSWISKINRFYPAHLLNWSNCSCVVEFLREPASEVDANQSHRSLRTPLRRNGVHQPCSESPSAGANGATHDDVIKWKNFPRYWRFVRGIHRSPMISPHKGQWRGALMFSLICVWINDWVNNREAGNLICYRTHYDVIVIISACKNQCMAVLSPVC